MRETAPSFEHPFVSLLSKIPLPYGYTAFLFGFLQYELFFILVAGSSDSYIILSSPMHLMQILLSITISFGLYSLNRFYVILSNQLKMIQSRSSMDEIQFKKFISKEIKMMGSLYSIIVGLPFGFAIIYTLFFIVINRMPNNIFPVMPFSLIWIYSAFIELGIEMGWLLYGISVCIGINIILLYRKICKNPKFSIDPFDPQEVAGFNPLFQIIFEGTIMYSILITLGFIVIGYTLYYYRNDFQGIFLIPIFFEGIVIASAFLFFFIPQYYIHDMILKKKTEYIRSLNDRSSKVLYNLNTICDVKKRQEYFIEGQYWIVMSQYVGRIHTWPFNFFTLIKGIGSLSIPLITLLAKYIFFGTI